jgi:hypothetical protein
VHPRCTAGQTRNQRGTADKAGNGFFQRAYVSTDESRPLCAQHQHQSIVSGCQRKIDRRVATRRDTLSLEHSKQQIPVDLRAATLAYRASLTSFSSFPCIHCGATHERIAHQTAPAIHLAVSDCSSSIFRVLAHLKELRSTIVEHSIPVQGTASTSGFHVPIRCLFAHDTFAYSMQRVQ